MAQTAINQLEPNQLIEGVFAIQNCQLGQTRGGKPYIKCLLADKTGRLPGRMWNANEAIFNALPTDGFVTLEGQTQPYQGEIQIIIHSIMPVEPSNEQLTYLIPSTEENIEEMFTEVKAMLDGFTNPALKAIADVYLNNEQLMDDFKQAPAAQTIHHAYLGGLLEHTRQLMRIAKATLPFYPSINGDIVLLGLFLHDLGKTTELTWKKGFGYTTDGMLVGHIATGMIWLSKAIDQVRAAGTEVPADLESVLQNIILSHHGEPEYGAIKLPSTPEAILVSHIDNLDAKTAIAVKAVNDARNTGSVDSAFTDKNFALNTRIYKKDPTA